MAWEKNQQAWQQQNTEDSWMGRSFGQEKNQEQIQSLVLHSLSDPMRELVPQASELVQNLQRLSQDSARLVGQ